MKKPQKSKLGHLPQNSTRSTFMERNTIFIPKQKTSNSQKKPIKRKSVLKSSNSKIEENKKKIYKIIEDNLLLTKIKTLQAKNDLMFYNSANEAQNNFEETLEKLFKEKMDKFNEINKKYDNEIYELKQDIEEEDIIKKNENNNKEEKGSVNSSLKLIYDNLLEDKKKEIEKLETEYDNKINRAKENYMENFESEELDEKSIIYRNELIGNLRTQIEDIIKPPNNRKVIFDIK